MFAQRIKGYDGGGTVTDITPSDLATGREDAAANAGFGGGFYGTGYLETQDKSIKTASHNLLQRGLSVTGVNI